MRRRLLILLKALRQLGFAPLAMLALYRLGLRLGWFRLVEPDPARLVTGATVCRPCVMLPSRADLRAALREDGVQQVLSEAEGILAGSYRPFYGDPTPLRFVLDLPCAHWSAYERGVVKIPYDALGFPQPDIKFVWEAARFGWAFTLGRAYRLSGEGKYARAFWEYFEAFDVANPPYLGPQWMSGQEVALRLMALVWADAVFTDSGESTPARRKRLAAAVAAHAVRIPATLIYARAQNNNHLLSEAAGLYTAALALPDHPQAERWRRLGLKWLRWGFAHQFDAEGEYIQHSTTYHRLALQVGLWVAMLTTKDTKPPHGDLRASSCPSWLASPLAAATRWLAALTDLHSGDAPNLGSNDGAYIFPLAASGHRDFRPVVQAAARVFLGESVFPPGPWDEMSLWFGLPAGKQVTARPSLKSTINNPHSASWGLLRVPGGNLRLAHADHLHLDLWWRGLNIALDPGTYLYNGAPPWDNPWPAAAYHNTVTVNGAEPMTRAGRFLYLDWAQARLVERSPQHLVAEHDGYRKWGVIHRRSITVTAREWRVEDELYPISHSQFSARLHWLLPDWEWELVNAECGMQNVECKLRIRSPHGWIEVAVRGPRSSVRDFSLVRAGELLAGTAVSSLSPTRGWYSPTYGVKIPALSLAFEASPGGRITFITTFRFPN